MGRGRKGLLDNLASLPWPVGLVAGAFVFLLFRHLIPAWLYAQDGPLTQAFAQTNPFTSLAWIFFALCTMASLVSFLRAQRNRQLLDTRTGLESIAALGWRDFERLVGEAFRRHGYVVEETGLGGADGGIDLILRRNGKRTLVQCKQWRQQKVPVNVVREMYGLLAHHGADEVRIATIGGFTPDAAKFAEGKPIALIDGAALLGMIRGVQVGDVPFRHQPVGTVSNEVEVTTSSVPECPRCGAEMVKRKNRQSGSVFWGCSVYPMCRGVR